MLEDEDDEFSHVKIKNEEVRGVANDFNEFLAQQGRNGNGHGNGFNTVMDGLHAEQKAENEGQGVGGEEMFDEI